MSAIDDIFDRPRAASDWSRRIRPVPSNSDTVQVPEYSDAAVMRARYRELQAKFRPQAQQLAVERAAAQARERAAEEKRERERQEAERIERERLALLAPSEPDPVEPPPLPSPDVETIRELVRAASQQPRPWSINGWSAESRGPIPARAIVARIAEAHGFSADNLIGPRRSADLVAARHEAMHAVWRLCLNLSLPAVGCVFNRDHTTVLHAVHKVEARLKAERMQDLAA